jgi:hypothetical protein
MATRSLFRLVPAAGAAILLLGTAPPAPGEPVLEGRAPTRAELRPAVEAAFVRESYPPGTPAQLVISGRARGLRLQVFRSGPERIVTRTGTTMNGVPMTASLAIGASAGRRVVSAYNFHRYDLPFLRWLARTKREVDLLAQSDLEAAPSARALAAAYELIVFPGHHEYVTKREYDLVEDYRDRGGNLMFLSANNFFWRVVKRGGLMTKTKL